MGSIVTNARAFCLFDLALDFFAFGLQLLVGGRTLPFVVCFSSDAGDCSRTVSWESYDDSRIVRPEPAMCIACVLIGGLEQGNGVLPAAKALRTQIGSDKSSDSSCRFESVDSEIGLLVSSWLVRFSGSSRRGDASCSISRTGLSMMGSVVEGVSALEQEAGGKIFWGKWRDKNEKGG